jgi:hypothetical protein
MQFRNKWKSFVDYLNESRVPLPGVNMKDRGSMFAAAVVSAVLLVSAG